jgi:hypothetical protein
MKATRVGKELRDDKSQDKCHASEEKDHTK